MSLRVVLLVSVFSMLIVSLWAQPTSSPSPSDAQNSTLLDIGRVRRGSDQASPQAIGGPTQGSSTSAPADAIQAQPSDAASNSVPIKRSVGQDKSQAMACPCG